MVDVRDKGWRDQMLTKAALSMQFFADTIAASFFRQVAKID